MNILVTAGNTLVPIDRVRGITNIFTGRTGAEIAMHAHECGHSVLLLTSNPASAKMPASSSRWRIQTFSTFDELEELLARNVSQPGLDAAVHCAAVSDYRAAGVYAPAPGTLFDRERNVWQQDRNQPPEFHDRAAGKVKSDEPELWLRLVRTPKLIDRFRSGWHFRGLLVKFKLEVGITDSELLRIAEESRRQSQADLMVANTLEGARAWAYLGPRDGSYRKITRQDLPAALLSVLEQMHEERTHG